MAEENAPKSNAKPSVWPVILLVAVVFGFVLLLKACNGESPRSSEVPMVEHGVINEKRIQDVAHEETCHEAMKRGEHPLGCEKFDYSLRK